MFRQFGEILDYKFNERYVFLTYKNRADALQAIETMDGESEMHKKFNLRVEWAHGKDDRDAR